MNEKVLSVIIPSYNAESFLRKGIPTFLAQEIMDDIEILIVDDGSKDSTGEIADEYQDKYAGVIRAIHKENGGHGSTINKGIEAACGKYFFVVDADDWVDTVKFVEFVNLLKSCDSDIVLTDAAIVNQDGAVTGHEWVGKLDSGKEMNIEDCFLKIKNIEMHNYCIKTRILKENGIKCHEHHFYVDNEYTVYSMIHVKTVTYYDMVLYQYLVGRVGQSISIERRRKCFEQYQNVGKFLIEFYHKNSSKMMPNQKDFYCRKIAYFLSGVYPILMSYNNRERKAQLKEFDDRIKKQSPEIYAANKNLCITVMRVSGFWLYGFCSWLYRVVNGIRD